MRPGVLCQSSGNADVLLTSDAAAAAVVLQVVNNVEAGVLEPALSKTKMIQVSTAAACTPAVLYYCIAKALCISVCATDLCNCYSCSVYGCVSLAVPRNLMSQCLSLTCCRRDVIVVG